MRLGNQRGMISVISAVTLFVLGLFCLGAISVAQVATRMKTQQNAADAWALGNAMQSELSLQQSQLQAPLDVPTVTTINLDQGDAASSINLYKGDYGGATATPGGLYIPGYVHVTMNYPMPPFVFTRQPIQSTARAYFNQVQMSKFIVVKPWTMLLLDFSPSMFLPVTAGGTAAYRAMQAGVSQYIQSPLAQRVNWGMRLFAGGNVAPVDQASYSLFSNTLNLNPSTDLNFNEQTMIGTMAATIAASKPGGDSTDVGSTIEDVLPTLLPASSNQDPNFGRAFILLVSDGEPDSFHGDYPSSMTYLEKVTAADNATYPIAQQAIADNVSIFTISINRQNEAFSQAADEDFLKHISGTPSTGLGNDANFALNANSETDLIAELTTFDPGPRCRSAANLLQMNVPPGRIPQAADLHFGYLTGIAGSGAEVRATFCGTGDSLTLPKNFPDVNNCMFNSEWPGPTIDASGHVTNKAVANYAFYYDSRFNVYETNSWVCAEYLDVAAGGDNAGNSLTFRVRYGVPFMECSPNINNCKL